MSTPSPIRIVPAEYPAPGGPDIQLSFLFGSLNQLRAFWSTVATRTSSLPEPVDSQLRVAIFSHDFPGGLSPASVTWRHYQLRSKSVFVCRFGIDEVAFDETIPFHRWESSDPPDVGTAKLFSLCRTLASVALQADEQLAFMLVREFLSLDASAMELYPGVFATHACMTKFYRNLTVENASRAIMPVRVFLATRPIDV
ncbi:MAG: hypothetical protein ACK5ZG_00795 [Phycisphaerae bacterium]